MKLKILFSLLIFSSCVEAFAQEEDEYFKPLSKRKDMPNSTYKNLDRKYHSLYVSIEGGFKLNYSSFNNTMNNLLGNQNNNDFSWGATLGYNFDNRWSAETGYMKNPVYFIQSVASGRGVPFTYRIGTALDAIPLRFKYRVFMLDAVTKSAGLFIGAGVLLNANTKERLIYERSFTGVSGSRVKPDTIRLTSASYITKKLSTSLEINAELQGRVANGFYISLYSRAYIAPNAGLRSDLVYYQNSNKIAEATQSLKGISYNFGLLLRLDLARGYRYQSQVE